MTTFLIVATSSLVPKPNWPYVGKLDVFVSQRKTQPEQDSTYRLAS